ncbi:MAG: L,D-transpeptidase [Chthoniobacterales bacterium]|nr:L,D-transpeptidase [Chthoniobacterales bacterium]
MKLSTGAQKLYIVEEDRVLLATPVTVGKPNSPTPHGKFIVRNKEKYRRRISEPGAGYPLAYWIEFYKPGYGFHWGFVKPYPSTMGCVRMPLHSARKVFELVRVGTPISIAKEQPWDKTIGQKLPILDDSDLPDPPLSYMLSQQVFLDMEKGKLWNF